MNTTKNRRSPMTPGERLMFLAGVLFCLVLITTSMMGGLFARYTTTGTGSDSARVAGFHVDVTGPDGVDINYAIDEDTGTYQLEIANNSEVAVSYSVAVDVEGSPDFPIQVALQDITLNTQNDDHLDFGTVGSLAASTSGTCDLVFSVLDWGEFTKQVNGSSREVNLDFTVHIDVVQID